LQHGLGKEEQHYVVPSGMDIAKFQSAKVDDWRKLINPEQLATKHPQFIAFVGSYEPRKRHLELLPLFAEVVKACPDAVLLFLGEGENEAKIWAKITELHLEQHVLMLGFQPNVEAYLAISQLGILPSAREGLARVVIQYVLAGLPVVCTNTPGVNLIAKDGENALIAPVDDITPMQQQIITVLQDEALRKRMSNASRAQDLSQWGIDHMVNSIETIYQKYAKV
jgi:Glycosyltransferase